MACGPGLALLLSACATPEEPGYPSLLPRAAEQERVITPPGDAALAGLPAAEEAALADELQRIERALNTTRAAIGAAEVDLAARLQAGGDAAIGSEPWSYAQMALSRLDDARAPLALHENALTPLRLQTDSLPADHASRRAVETLAAAIAAERARVDAVASAAEHRLARR